MTRLTMIREKEESDINIVEFINKYNITDDISSLSDDAVSEYLDILYEQSKDAIEYNHLMIADVISDIVVIQILKDNDEKYINDYVKYNLLYKYSGEFVDIGFEYGIKFEDEKERSEYLWKCVKIFDKDKIKDIALDYACFKFHTLCFCSYVFNIEKIKNIIQIIYTDQLVYDILDNAYFKIYREYIKNMGFEIG